MNSIRFHHHHPPTVMLTMNASTLVTTTTPTSGHRQCDDDDDDRVMDLSSIEKCCRDTGLEVWVFCVIPQPRVRRAALFWAMFPSWPRSAMLKVILAFWRLQVSLRRAAALEAEVTRLKAVVGRRAGNIWEMRKDELMEVARKELGFTTAQLAKETVVTLREKIRRSRTEARIEADPLASLPKGLERMSQQDLVRECLARSLDPQALPDQQHRGAFRTRPQMILMIREDVELRITSSQTEPSPTPRTPRTSSKQSRRGSERAVGDSRGSSDFAVADWEMADGSR